MRTSDLKVPYSLYTSNITIDGFMIGSSEANTGRRLIISDIANNVVIKNNIIQNTGAVPDGSSANGYSGHGVYIYPGADNALVEYNTFYNTMWEAIASDGASNAVITHNYISVTGQHAIQWMNHTGSDNKISYNHISSITDKNAIQYWGGPRVNISNNVIAGNNTMNDGIWLDNSADDSIVSYNEISNTIYAGVNIRETNIGTSVQYNDISGCGTGIEKHAGDVTGTIINYNKIYGNSAGVTNDDSVTINAANNYWGAITGPASCSGGDQVSANVEYSPWYIDDTLDSTKTREYNVQNTTQSTTHDCIQEAVTAASPGDTINVAAGTYEIDSSINVAKSVTITTDASATIISATLDTPVFNITADNVTIENFNITTSLAPFSQAGSVTGSETSGALILINASNVTISGNTIYADETLLGEMKTWTTRGITLQAGSATIKGNTIYGVRNGIVVRPGNSASITDNVIFDTKGGIMHYTSSQDDANTHTTTGNSWTSTVSGLISHNEWDIVWNTAYYAPDYQQSVIALSNSNNGAYILDRRTVDASYPTDNVKNAAACAALAGNRSHVFVDANSSIIAAHPAKGNFNEKFSTIALGIDAVVLGGTVYVAAGIYDENPTVSGKQLNFVGAVDGDGHPLPTIQGTLSIDLPGADDNWRIENINFLADTDSGTALLLLKNVNGVTVKNSTFDGNGRFMEGSSVNGVNFTSCSNVIIENSIFKNGLYVAINGYVNHLTVRDSTIKNVKSGINLQGGGGNLVVENTDISVIAQTTENDTYGVRFASIGSGSGVDMTITGGSISVNKNDLVADAATYHSAIIIRSGATGILKANTIAINGDVVNLSAVQLDAKNNYWGDENGPGELISDYITYDPWFINTEKTTLSNSTVVPDNSGNATVTNDAPQVVITNQTQATTVTISSGTTNPKIDVSLFISEGTGTLPEINITSANANNATVAIPASTKVTSADDTWNGIIAAPTVTTVTLPKTLGQTKTSSIAIEVGFTGAKLSFDKAVRLLLPGQTGKRVGYVRTGTEFTEITNTCTADDQATVDAYLTGSKEDCKIDNGSDLVIWTKHFTKFATYTQTTTSFGGVTLPQQSQTTPIKETVTTPTKPEEQVEVLGVEPIKEIVTTPTKPEEQVEVLGVELNYRATQLDKIINEAGFAYKGDVSLILNNIKGIRNIANELAGSNKYTLSLVKNSGLTLNQAYSMTNFIVYGTETTAKLGAGERAGVMNSYKTSFGKLPTTQTEWEDVIKIANGRWPSEANQPAENKAKEEFKKVYQRDANMDNANDNAAITMVAYGLRPDIRNLDSERTAIQAFKTIFGCNPVSTTTWDVVRAIAYSGSIK